jgi:ABC-type ATPase involved in cell division
MVGTEVLNEAQNAVAGWRRVIAVLDTPQDVADPGEAGAVLARGPVEVRFEHVSYAYPDGPPVLLDVDVTLAAGSRVAVVGQTGSGKTTFVKLLTRLMDPDEGRVTLNGTDLRDIRFSSLRRRVVMVPQDGFLFAGSLRDNVRYGRLDATDEQIGAALTDLGLDEWFQGLGRGLDTPVGQRGESLSAGERQLVAIARAYVATPTSWCSTRRCPASTRRRRVCCSGRWKGRPAGVLPSRWPTACPPPRRPTRCSSSTAGGCRARPALRAGDPRRGVRRAARVLGDAAAHGLRRRGARRKNASELVQSARLRLRTVSVRRQRATSTNPGTRVLGAVAGILSAAVALGVAELAAAFVGAGSSPVIAVGGEVVDATPVWLKDFAIRTFGASDKLVLLSSVLVVVMMLAAVAGALAVRRRILGLAFVAVLAVAGATAALVRPTASALDALPSLLGGAIGAAVMVQLLRSLRAEPAPDADEDVAAHSPRTLARRAFVLGSAAAAGPRRRHGLRWPRPAAALGRHGVERRRAARRGDRRGPGDPAVPSSTCPGSRPSPLPAATSTA